MSTTTLLSQPQAANFAPSEEVVASNVTARTLLHSSGSIDQASGIPLTELTGVKLEKLGMFMPYFGDRTYEFVKKCNGRGDQSWKNVAKRIHELDTSDDPAVINYTARLYEEFDIDKTYDLGTIIYTVGSIRRELKMPIEEQSNKWYIQQISNVFLLEKELDKSLGYPKVTGYKFLFKLKP